MTIASSEIMERTNKDMEISKDAKRIIKDVQVKMEVQSNLSHNPSPSPIQADRTSSYYIGHISVIWSPIEAFLGSTER